MKAFQAGTRSATKNFCRDLKQEINGRKIDPDALNVVADRGPGGRVMIGTMKPAAKADYAI